MIRCVFHYFTIYGILHAYIYFQSFSVVEKESFRALLKYLRPSIVLRDIASQTTVMDEIYTKSVRVKGLLAEKFKLLDSRVSFTFDAGTSRAFDPYLTVTGHWINASWNLHEQVLAFREIIGDHSGENTGALLVEILGEHGLVNPNKLGWGTANGSTVQGDCCLGQVCRPYPPKLGCKGAPCTLYGAHHPLCIPVFCQHDMPNPDGVHQVKAGHRRS